jgi:uncharacterized oxidoreductase
LAETLPLLLRKVKAYLCQAGEAWEKPVPSYTMTAEDTMKLTGNTVVVTGGTSGIGLALVEKLLALGNNAGIQLAADLTRPIDMEKVRAELETNLVAPLHLALLFAPLLAKKDGAAIVNISSGLAFCPLAFMPVYRASKAAMHSLCLSMRRQMRDLGIAVYEIAPPSVDSELGREQRPAGETHGGMPVGEFVDAMLQALASGAPESAIGQAEGMRAKREALFEAMNR